MSKNPSPVVLDRLAHALQAQGLKLKRSQLLETAAYAFGYRNSNEFSAAASAGDINPPHATPVGRVTLPDGGTVLIVTDPLAPAPYGIDESFVERVVEDERRETIGVTPYGHLVRLEEVAAAEFPTIAGAASGPDLSTHLRAALEQIDLEIESRQASGDPTLWADLQTVSDLGHAALRASPAPSAAPSVLGGKIDVYVGSISHEHGHDLYVASTQEALDAQLAEYCRDNWHEIDDFPDVPKTPDGISDADLVSLYFDTCSNHDVEEYLDTSVEELNLGGSDPVKIRCERCDSPVLPNGRCSDETCAFHDFAQGDPRGWADHPEPPAGRIPGPSPLAGKPADWASQIADALENGVGADIWYDAHEHGGDDEDDPDREAEDTISDTQNAMSEAATILRALRPVRLPDGRIMVDDIVVQTDRAAATVAPPPFDEPKWITDRDGESTGSVTIGMLATLGIPFHQDRGETLPLTEREYEFLLAGETLNAHLDVPVRLGFSVLYDGRKWLAPDVEFGWDSSQDDFEDTAADALRRMNAYADHLRPTVEALGGRILTFEGATDSSHEMSVLLPFELAFESASVDDWRNALSYLLLTHAEQLDRDQVTCEFTAEVDANRMIMSIDPSGDTVWDATFDALRWGTQYAVAILTGSGDPDDYATSPLAPEWVRDHTSRHPFTVDPIGLREALRIAL